MSSTPRWPLERYRPLLRMQVRQLQLDPRLRSRFDDSDLVQEALLRAVQGLSDFRGRTEAELVAWLEQILVNVATDSIRRARAQKRDVALEQSLEATVSESAARLEHYLSANGPSPAQAAERHEQLCRLAAALDQLPDDQRDAILQRDLLGAAVAEIATQLGRTPKAVAGLLLRGRRRLRELLSEDASSAS